MSVIIRVVWDKYNELLEHGHPWSKDLPMVNRPTTMLSIIGIWLYFCLYAGPRYMKHRKPYELKTTLLVYNLIQILFSAFLFIAGGICGWFGRYNYICQPISYSKNPDYYEFLGVRLVWLYFINKIIELLDTVFFVLRKKNNQIGTLHVYHHSIMPIFAWVGIKYVPCGHGTFIGWANSFVHIVMYTYYFLAVLGPEYQKYLWWKKHVTELQLIQFILIFVHNFSVLFVDCAYPRALNYLGMLEAVIFIYMFGSFYYKNYINKDPKKLK